MEQRTKEWFDARVGMITASRIAPILGISRWESKKALLRRMVKETLPDWEPPGYMQAQQWGVDHEQQAREAYEAITGYQVETPGFLTHPDFPWAGASPDGIADGSINLEIKCPFSGEIPDEVPADYYAQCQWQMWVMGLETTHLFYWVLGGQKLFVVPYNFEWVCSILPAVEAFRDEYQAALKDPDAVLGLDMIDSSVWHDVAQEYLEVLAARDAVAVIVKEHEARLAELQVELRKLSAENPAHGHGIRLTSTSRKGTIDPIALQRDGIDPDNYRKPTTSYWTVRKEKAA